VKPLCLNYSQDIYLYDIANDVWYKQTAGGREIPEDRRRFCAGAAWADDRSSYNMFVKLTRIRAKHVLTSLSVISTAVLQ
jgi:hypothetical protein